MKNFFIPHILLIMFLLFTFSCGEESENEQEKFTEIELRTLNQQFSKHLDAINSKNDGTMPIFNVILNNENYIKHKSSVQFEFDWVNEKRMLGAKNQQGGKTFIYFKDYMNPTVFELVTILPKTNESVFSYDINSLKSEKFNGHLLKSDIYHDKVKVEEYNNGELIRTQTPVKPENIQLGKDRTEMRTCFAIVLESYVYEGGFWVLTGEEVIGYTGDCANNEDQEGGNGGGGGGTYCNCINQGFSLEIAETLIFFGWMTHNLNVSVQNCATGIHSANVISDIHAFGNVVNVNNWYNETFKIYNWDNLTGNYCGAIVRYDAGGNYTQEVIGVSMGTGSWKVEENYFSY